MSYLPDNPTRERHTELYQPILFPKPMAARPAASARDWSNQAFWFTVVFLGGTALALLAWGNYSGPPQRRNTENPLQGQLAASKLKEKVATKEPPLAPLQVAVAEPPSPPTVELPEPMKIELPGLPMVAPPAPELLKIDAPAVAAPPAQALVAAPLKVAAPMPPLPPPPLAPVEDKAPIIEHQQEPQIFLGRSNPGETPMIRTWKTLALYSLLAVAPVAAPTPLVAGGQDDAAKLQKQFEDLRKLLDTAVKSIKAASDGIDAIKTDVTKLQEDVTTLKTARLAADIKVENLEKQLGNVQADVNFLKRELAKQAAGAGASVDRALMDEMKKHLVAIEQAILKLQPGETTSKRIALSPPAPTGRVVLTNLYHEDMLFVINQKAHRVQPGKALALEAIPAGTVEYEVLSESFGLRARNRTNLPANETFTLTAR